MAPFSLVLHLLGDILPALPRVSRLFRNLPCIYFITCSPLSFSFIFLSPLYRLLFLSFSLLSLLLTTFALNITSFVQRQKENSIDERERKWQKRPFEIASAEVAWSGHIRSRANAQTRRSFNGQAKSQRLDLSYSLSSPNSHASLQMPCGQSISYFQMHFVPQNRQCPVLHCLLCPPFLFRHLEFNEEKKDPEKKRVMWCDCDKEHPLRKVNFLFWTWRIEQFERILHRPSHISHDGMWWLLTRSVSLSFALFLFPLYCPFRDSCRIQDVGFSLPSFPPIFFSPTYLKQFLQVHYMALCITDFSFQICLAFAPFCGHCASDVRCRLWLRQPCAPHRYGMKTAQLVIEQC